MDHSWGQLERVQAWIGDKQRRLQEKLKHRGQISEADQKRRVLSQDSPQNRLHLMETLLWFPLKFHEPGPTRAKLKCWAWGQGC